LEVGRGDEVQEEEEEEDEDDEEAAVEEVELGGGAGAGEGGDGADGGEVVVPSKWAWRESEVAVRCAVRCVNMAGLSDGRSMRAILTQIAPHKHAAASGPSPQPLDLTLDPHQPGAHASSVTRAHLHAPRAWPFACLRARS
jgi:hypothetical protein